MAQPASAAPPTNDNFANATTITGASGTITGTTVDSTGETGEPAPGSTPIKSIWYSWVAPSAVPVSFDTCTSSFDTTMGAYTGTTVSALTTIITNDQATAVCSGTDQSRILFTPTSGATYKIKIDGFVGSFGTTRLSWSQTAVAAPPNDNFANAITLTGASGTVSGTNVGATSETGEPDNFSTGPIRSVWYRYTPASTGTLTVGLCATTTFDSAIGIYTGTAVNALTKLIADDDGCGITAGPSRITGYAVTAGTTYNISIDGYQGQTSAFSLAYTFTTSGPPPANDNLANAIALPGASGSVTGTTVNATGQTGEIRVSGTSATAKSVWYSWVAPSSGSATFGLCTGTTFDTLLGVYTGTAHPLTTVASNDDAAGCGVDEIQSRATFNAVAGTSYKIQVDGFTSSSGTASGPFTLTYSIAVPLTLAINDVTLNEGTTSTTSFDFTVTLSAAAASSVTVNYATANGTATAPADYATTSGTLTFAAGQTTRTISVPVVGDVTFEPTETFVVNLTTPVGATIADNQGLGTITNDDGQPAVSIGDVTQAEGDGGVANFSFPITLSNPSSTAVTVNFATADGTATSPTDYTAVSGTVTFPAGATTNGVVVEVQGDLLFEANETFFVNLSGVSGATLSDNQGVGTISNDDATPTLSINDVTRSEGDGGAIGYIFTVSLSNASEAPVTVDYASTDASATSPSDYTPVSGTLTFATGQTTQSVVVLANGDATFELNETFSVELSNAVGAGILDSSGVGTITNDDAAPVYSIDDVTAAEGDTGTSSLTFTVSRTGDTALPSTVQYSTTDGTADSPADFTATAGTLTFLPGDSSTTVTVQVNGDLIDELDETFTVDLASATNGTIGDGQGVGTITDDDAQPSVTIDDVTQVERDSGNSSFDFTVTLSNPSSRPVLVDYATTDGTATEPSDYDATAGTVTFAPGQTSATVSVSVSGDNTQEADETFFVDLSNPVRAGITEGRGVGTITNDDNAATLSIDDVTAAEGDSGTTAVTFTVTRSGPTALISTVNFATQNGSAVAPGDFTQTNGTLTFAPGQGTRQVTVQVVGDQTYENDESFTVHLSVPVNATIADADGLGTIQNDDPVPSVSVNDVSDDEGNSGTTPFDFTVTLSGPSEQTVTVDYVTSDGTATSTSDYATRTGNLTFAAGQTVKTVTVPVNGDTTFETNETFDVNLADATNATVADGVGTGTIGNDDARPSFSIGDVTHTEGDGGTTSYSFTVTLTGATTLPATVDYTTADGTAVDGVDYAAVSGSLTFLPGDTSKIVTVQVNGDLTFEPNETFTVVLSNASPSATISDASATGFIQNDDSQPTLSIGDESQGEGDTGTKTFAFAVTLSNPSSQTITAAYSTADGTATSPADYNTATGTVTFAPGEVSKTISVVVDSDVTAEADENFTVLLSAPNNATIADAIGIGTIIDDDPRPTISIADQSVAEGNSGSQLLTFTVALSNASGQTVGVSYATVAGSATATEDYAATSGTVTFAPGETSKTLAVSVLGDQKFEPIENFTVVLSSPTNATISDGTAVGTITNDDLQPTVSVSNATTVEQNSGSHPVTLQVTLSNPSYQTVTVNAQTSNGSATTPADYVNATPSATLTPGQTTGSFTVQVKGDTTYETDEFFNVDIAATNAGVADGHADVNITDDDAAPTLAINDVSRLEGNAGTTPFVFTVALTGASEVDATFGYTVVNGTASSPSDFVSDTGTVTIRGGDSSATVAVLVVGDAVVEPDETFTVQIGAAQDATISDSSGLGTIVNDDAGTGCTLTGTPGNDTLNGTAGVDVICGGDGNDVIRGLGGNDTLRGEGGSDTIVGGAGNDVIDGGAGVDTVAFDTDPAGVKVNLGAGTATDGYSNTDTLSSLEVASGSPFNDRLIGSAAADKLFGQAGADALGGLGGSDVLNGGGGADRGDAGGGTDQCVSVEQSVNCEPAAADAESGVLGLYGTLAQPESDTSGQERSTQQ